MELWPASAEDKKVVATKTVIGKLTKDKTIKIRLDALEVLELNEVARSLGYIERATTIRWLIKHYSDIKSAADLVQKFRAREQAEKELAETIK